MGSMMHNGRRGGCKCCNDWEEYGRNIDRREVRNVLKQELGTFRPLMIDPRWFDPERLS